MSIRFASLAAVGLLAAGCHVGADAEDREPGAEVTRSYQVGAFDRLEVAGPYEVNVVTGGQGGVTRQGRREPARRDRSDRREGNVLKIQPEEEEGHPLELAQRQGRVHRQRRGAAWCGDRRIGRSHGRQGRRRFRRRSRGLRRPQGRPDCRRPGEVRHRRIGRSRGGRQGRCGRHFDRRIGRHQRSAGSPAGPPTFRSPDPAMSRPTPATAPMCRSWDPATSTSAAAPSARYPRRDPATSAADDVDDSLTM